MISAGNANPGADAVAIYADVGAFAHRRITGIARYTARLCLALARVAQLRFFHAGEEVVAADGLDWSHDQDLARWCRRVWCGARRPLRRISPGAIGLYGTLRPPHRVFPREISVLYDFTPLLTPELHEERTRREFQDYFGRTIALSDAVLAISASTKADALWLAAVDPARVFDVPTGPSLCVERHLDASATPRRNHVGLVTATLEPRKNGPFLLDWFLNSKRIPHNAELWWVGARGWLTSRRTLRALSRGDGRSRRRVRFLGVVPDQALCRLYRTAAWTAHPSLYEGFCFPVLDSLRHGTPALVAHHSSMREFDMPGVSFFDPRDASTLDDAYAASSLAPRSVATCEQIDARFDWRLVARRILDRFHAASEAASSPSRAA